MTFSFRRQRADESATVYEQRRRAAEEAYEQRERELDEWDAMMAEAHEITHQADTLAARMALGMATLSEVQDFLASDPQGANPYVDLRALTTQCLLMDIDPSTGSPLPC